MDRLRETQLTQRATRRPYEYNYTNADVNNNAYDPSRGYQFEYPVNWTGDPSTNKVIGLRRISYKPASVNLAFNFHIRAAAAVPAVIDPETGTEISPAVPVVYVDIPVIGTYTSENTFEEILADIVKQTTTGLAADGVSTYNIQPSMAYDKEAGTFTLRFSTPTAFKSFTVNFAYETSNTAYNPSNDDDWQDMSKTYFKREFLKLFNQKIDKANIDRVYNFGTTTLTFDNVWNRDTFYCHASFSDSPRKIIGINKDFWPTPSVFYEYSDNSNDFNIYFTTDTVRRILPLNGVLLIQISYIYNYQTSYLSY